MVASRWHVKFFDLGEDEDALDELTKAERLTGKQIVRINGHVERLERHGHDLNGDFFDNVAGSKRGLREFRIRADKVAIRFLYKLRGDTFVMLRGYKHTNRRDVNRHITVAETRLDEWDKKHESR